MSMFKRFCWLFLGVLPLRAAAQIPTDFANLELRRSRECVGILGRVDALDAELAPLANRSQRLLAIGQAIALEEREVMESLRTSDPLEARVRAWFEADGELARQYMASPGPALLTKRSAGRDSIQAAVRQELETIQERADSAIARTGTLGSEAGNCSGAVFIRPAVIEACAATSSPVCDAARDSTNATPEIRFVESAEVLWGLQELRAWTAAGPIQVGQSGQLGGARTLGFTRAGNIVVTVAYGPRLRRRADLTTAEATRVDAIADSLGFGTAHPDIVFTPSVALQATLPAAIGGEARYVAHFGPPEEADIILAIDAGTGVAVEGVVDLGPGRLAKLVGGEPLTLTALRAAADGSDEVVYSVELTALNQGRTTTALTAYMAQQLGNDLAQLFPTGEATPPTGAPTPR